VRYNKHINEGEKKAANVAWSEEEEQLLKALKEKCHSWEKIAESFPTRTAPACQKRYLNHVNDGEKRLWVLYSRIYLV
jgi:hypothetical protein